MTVLVDIVVSALRELSDRDYQLRVWTGSDARGEMSSPEECIARLFDDSNLNIALDAGEDIFGDAIDREIRMIQSLLTRIDFATNPYRIIEDPLMAQVREHASFALRALDLPRA